MKNAFFGQFGAGLLEKSRRACQIAHLEKKPLSKCKRDPKKAFADQDVLLPDHS